MLRNPEKASVVFGYSFGRAILIWILEKGADSARIGTWREDFFCISCRVEMANTKALLPETCSDDVINTSLLNLCFFFAQPFRYSCFPHWGPWSFWLRMEANLIEGLARKVNLRSLSELNLHHNESPKVSKWAWKIWKCFIWISSDCQSPASIDASA